MTEDEFHALLEDHAENGLSRAIAEHGTPAFYEWWETNGGWVMSIWENPWMKVHAMKIFNAGRESVDENVAA